MRSRYTPATVLTILAVLEAGEGVASAARSAGVSRRVIYRWCAVRPRFRQRVREAQAKGMTAVP